MSVGLNIKDNTKILLGDSIESVLSKLKEAELKYSIPFDKVTRQSGIHETIMSLDDLGIEVSLENGVVTFIKSVPNKETTVMLVNEAADLKMIDYLNRIKEFIQNKVGAGDIRIDNFDAKSLNTVASFNSGSNKVRVTILRSNRGELFLNTINTITKI